MEGRNVIQPWYDRVSAWYGVGAAVVLLGAAVVAADSKFAFDVFVMAALAVLIATGFVVMTRPNRKH